MNILSGTELFDYLDILCKGLDKKKSEVDMNSFAYMAHTQMGDVFKAEKQFLKETNPSFTTRPKLSFALTGLPAAESLDKDLDKMCEVYDVKHINGNKVDGAALVASQFLKDKNFNFVDWSMYSQVSKSDWDKKFASKSKDGALKRKLFFYVAENPDSLELSLAECFYAPGLDKYSQTIPVLITSGKVDYKMAWNNVFSKDVVAYHVLNNEIAKSGISSMTPAKSKKYYDDIRRNFPAERKDFKGLGFWKNMFLKRNSDKINYKAFMESGYKARVDKANRVLDALEMAYGGKIVLQQGGKKTYDRHDLAEMLKYSEIVDDLKKKVPDKKSGHNLEETYTLVNSSKYTCTDDNKVGTITFIVPHDETHYGSYGGRYYRFKKGGIKIELNGALIDSDELYKRINKELGKI